MKKYELTVTTNVSELINCNAITHAGKFHADEVMTTALMRYLNNVHLLRIFNIKAVAKDIPNMPCQPLIYDIGDEAGYSEYDHHSSKKFREGTTVPFAAVGLIYYDFGKEIIRRLYPEIADNNEMVDAIFKSVDENLIKCIDGGDNGIPSSYSPDGTIEKNYSSFNVSSLISSYYPEWDSDKDENEAFIEAVEEAGKIFELVLKESVSKVKAKHIVEKAIEESKNHIMFLDKYVPWPENMFNSNNPKMEDIWYAIFPSQRGGYNIQAVPLIPGSLDQRKPVPSDWRANPKATGVKDCTFVHLSGFLAACDSLEGAYEYANKAVKEAIKKGE